MREETGTEYFLDVHDRHYAGSPGQPAGIYWLNGDTMIAAHGSSAERRLLEQGAFHIATLLFGRDPLESSQRGGRVERMRATEVLRQLAMGGH